MSTLNTMDQLIVKLKARIPIGLTTAQCAAQLNEAWHFLEERGAFTWNVRRATLTVASAAVTPAGIPNDWDIGKPASIYPSSLGFAYEVKYLPFEEWVRQQTFHFTPPAGVFSCWTYISAFSGSQPNPTYTITFAPANAAPGGGGATYTMFYHHEIEADIATGANYFPTPNAFDEMLVDGAEAEFKRIYSLNGWESAQKKFENEIQVLLDKYRSPKHDLAGLSEGMMEVQEKAAE
jgi:hypothetical protein